jgi:hypothetical protein
MSNSLESKRIFINKEERVTPKPHVDTYTKFVLTVIALCLVFICLRDIKVFPPLYGSTNDIVDVRIRAIEKTPEQTWDPVAIDISDNMPVEVENTAAIPVEIKNSPLPVDVKSVAMKSTLVPVEVKQEK